MTNIPEIDALNDCNPREVPEFGFDGLKCFGRIVDVHDGDTVTVILKYVDHLFKFHIRMLGIDAFETTSKNEILHAKAYQGRDRLIEILCGLEPGAFTEGYPILAKRKDVKAFLEDRKPIVWMECVENDKYGRILCNIYTYPEKQSVAELLLAEKLAYEYNGKTRLTEQDQLTLIQR